MCKRWSSKSRKALQTATIIKHSWNHRGKVNGFEQLTYRAQQSGRDTNNHTKSHSDAQAKQVDARTRPRHGTNQHSARQHKRHKTTLTYTADYNSKLWLCCEQQWLQYNMTRKHVESTLKRADLKGKEATTNNNSVCTWKTINIWSRCGDFWSPSLDSRVTLTFETLPGSHFCVKVTWNHRKKLQRPRGSSSELGTAVCRKLMSWPSTTLSLPESQERFSTSFSGGWQELNCWN